MNIVLIWIAAALASLSGLLPITHNPPAEPVEAPVGVAIVEPTTTITTTTAVPIEGQVCVAVYPRPPECDAPPVTIEPWLQEPPVDTVPK